jgi:hypothetical protein
MHEESSDAFYNGTFSMHIKYRFWSSRSRPGRDGLSYPDEQLDGRVNCDRPIPSEVSASQQRQEPMGNLRGEMAVLITVSGINLRGRTTNP